MMTLRRYSKLTSSSDFAVVAGDEGLDDVSRDVKSEIDDLGDLISDVLSLREAQ